MRTCFQHDSSTAAVARQLSVDLWRRGHLLASPSEFLEGALSGSVHASWLVRA
jgi:hypothetical protein